MTSIKWSEPTKRFPATAQTTRQNRDNSTEPNKQIHSHSHNDLIAAFKEEHLEKELVDGRPSRETAIEHQATKRRFIQTAAQTAG